MGYLIDVLFRNTYSTSTIAANIATIYSYNMQAAYVKSIRCLYNGSHTWGSP